MDVRQANKLAFRFEFSQGVMLSHVTLFTS